MVDVVISRHTGTGAPELEPLLDTGEAEGFSFVARTLDEWASGVNRFDQPNEAFFLATAGGAVVGMCGVNVDPYVDDPSVGRLRHLYVHPSQRSVGIGEQLVDACLSHAWGRFNIVRLRTPGEAADRFYEAVGFRRVASDTASHERWPHRRYREFCLSWAELVREAQKCPFEPGGLPTCVRLVGSINRGLVHVASEHADNFRLDDVIDGGGVHYWESASSELAVYSTHSIGFASRGDIVSRTTFHDRGDRMDATLLIGNLDGTTGMATEYNRAVLLRHDDEVMLMGKRLEPISWTQVLTATITVDDEIVVV